MEPSDVKRELERLAEEAAAARDRLAALAHKMSEVISAATELAATVRSGSAGAKPDERTPEEQPAQEPGQDSGDAHAR